MTNIQNRRPGLLAGLNFNLPFSSRSPVHESDMVVQIALKGGGRKATRYSIDLSGWYKRINDGIMSKNNLYEPHHIAIANDPANNLFVIFDSEKEIEQSLPIVLQPSGALSLSSKPAVQKVFIVLKQPQPASPGQAIKMLFKMEKVNNDTRYWQAIPIKAVSEEMGNKSTPKVINL